MSLKKKIENADDFVLLIPSLDPDDKLIGLLKNLKEYGFSNILIVNDGSHSEKLHFFEEAKKDYGCSVFTHAKNYGKGRALKNAFNFLLTEYKDFKYVITLDSDGQHKPKDVEKMALKLMESKDKDLIMGCRSFGKGVKNQNGDEVKIPFRSQFGNILTRNVLKVLCGVKVSDTQTGLRGFSRELLKEFLDTPGERFEYELNMLIETKEKEIKIVEVPIETVYLEENKSSHFRPIRDSIRIYSLFFKFICVSLLSFLLDIVLFAIFVAVFKNITIAYYVYISTILARVLSAVFNFMVNKNTVFKKKDSSKRYIIGYFLLAVFIMGCSALLTNILVKGLYWNEVITKILVDCVLSLLSYTVQRDIIFVNKKKADKEC